MGTVPTWTVPIFQNFAMHLLKHPREMQRLAKSWRQSGKSVGFIPTMGSLHAGHLSLVEASKNGNDLTVVSIFVNPAQFESAEDFQNYPKNLANDLEILQGKNVEAVFAPEAVEMFPMDYETTVSLEKLSGYLCGPFRPGHFRGVAAVVLKLFHLVLPARAYFGEKDYQQLRIIQKMVQDLSLDVEIVDCPTIREKDGLAMSSRNSLLSKDERKEAVVLYQALGKGKEAILRGEKDAAGIKKIMRETVVRFSSIALDYAEVSHPVTLEPLRTINSDALLAAAGRIGKVRLIDNVRVRSRQA